MGFKFKLLVICASLFLGANAYADTRVLVYNNTLKTLDFDLRQTDTRLGSSYWSRGETSISPSKANEVLSIKKSGGVTDGNIYGFEIDMSDGSSTLVLKVRIEGLTVGRETSQAVGNGQFDKNFALRVAQWGQRTVRYKMEGNGDLMFVVSDPSQSLFRFPVQDRTLIGEGSSALRPMVGPLSLDMRSGLSNRGITYKWEYSCMDYNGNKNPPYCYSDHKGTDFMLKGGFRQMDRPGNFIVAARAGIGV